MPSARNTRHIVQGVRAIKRLALIDTEIVGLPDEDLLDLADIFAKAEGSPIAEIAAAEMERRGISIYPPLIPATDAL